MSEEFEIFNKIGGKPLGIRISSFQVRYRPLDLAQRLKSLEVFLDFDWLNDKVKLKKHDSSLKNLVLKKDRVVRRKKKTPDSFKIEKIEKNRPYLPKREDKN